MFDSNAMNELRHVAADRYQRAGGGGARRVVSSRTHWDERLRDASVWQKAVAEHLQRYREVVALNRSHYAMDCFRAREGIADDQDIPF